jgi:hypothetical protein
MELIYFIVSDHFIQITVGWRGWAQRARDFRRGMERDGEGQRGTSRDGEGR